MKSFKHLLLLSSLFLLAGCLDSTSSDFDEYDNTADLEYLEENRQKEGVTELESGLQYRVIEEGDGISPTEESIVVFDFIGTFVDGEEFNDTYESGSKAISFLNELPPGLEEGLKLMNIGATYEFVLPADLAYGDRPPQGFPPGATLIFELELVHDSNFDSVFLEQNAQEDDVTVTESGLQYRVIEEGDGETPSANADVEVEYTGTFVYGDIFDDSRESDDSVTFNLQGVIPGFAEGLQLMQEGARYELVMPGELGYGEDPPQGIYPNAALIFDVELISVQETQ
ncbi:MAG: FKBP-type peptidyl-prolyl cis-trans isomerase [Balneolaceae bacterium]